MRIYHYTTIDTLALILKNRTIRFNRLDNLDDLKEGVPDKTGYVPFYSFVSCWTDTPEENIAQWKLYTQGTGVRISMESNMFKSYNIYDTATPKDCSMPKSLIPYEDQYGSTKDYFVFPVFENFESCDYFLQKIEYRKDYNKQEKLFRTYDGKFVKINKEEIGKVKDSIWEFQSEIRFILDIYPFKPVQRMFDGVRFEYSSLHNSMLSMSKSMLFNESPSISEYFMHLKDNAFDSLEVTLYPGCTESHKTIVDSLLKEYAPHVKARPSELEGKVRLK